MNLSDKQVAINGYGYDEEDVKEFIQDLNKSILYIGIQDKEQEKWILNIIKELAGDKLI